MCPVRFVTYVSGRLVSTATNQNLLAMFWCTITEDVAAGQDIKLNLDNAARTITDLAGRALQAMRHVVDGTPVVLSGALVVPAGLLRKRRGEEAPDRVVAGRCCPDAVNWKSFFRAGRSTQTQQS